MTDDELMMLAIKEARGCNHPDTKNVPKVGAVIYASGERFVGQRGPDDHAEKIALDRAAQAGKGHLIRGATVYTTLEPCTDAVRRRPLESCTSRLIDSKVKRVVIGILDPNQNVCGKGVLELQRADIEVSLFPHHLAEEVRAINADFIRAQQDLGVKIIKPLESQRFQRAMSAGRFVASIDVECEFQNDPDQSVAILMKRGGQWWPQESSFERVAGFTWRTRLSLGHVGEQTLHVVRANPLGCQLIAFRQEMVRRLEECRGLLAEKNVAKEILDLVPQPYMGIPMSALPKGLDSQAAVTITIV